MRVVRISAVPDILIYGDTVRSPELRHEVPVPIPDPFLYAEKGDRRVAILHSLEIPRVRADAPDLEILPLEQLGVDELLAQGNPWWQNELDIALRACRELAVVRVAVPATFPVAHADFLRANGVEVVVERDLFLDRRRSKNETELAGIRRAQRACEAGLDAARELLRQARPNGAGLEVEGEPLTSERLKRVIEDVFADHEVEGSDLIVSHGAQTAVGHDSGSGQIAPNEPIVFDLFPRDKATGCYSDMTRTYVVGEPTDEVKEWHSLVKQALESSTAAVKPGVNGRSLFEQVCNHFQAAGYKTQLNKEPGEVLEDGFFHSLGHGVGLEVHELPFMGRVGNDLIPGDVITIEPGLYRSGYGGVRLEDIVVVTEDGHEVITSYPYDLKP
jgi:Xaa-Pro aminopeptidase